MNRVLMVLAVPLVAVFLVGLWMYTVNDDVQASVDPQSCQRVRVADPFGAPLVGIEDLALIPGQGQLPDRLILSAYDRSGGRQSASGLFLLDASGLGTTEAVAIGIPGTGERLTPHGIAFEQVSGRLAYVSRDREGGASVVWGALEDGRFTETGRAEDEGLCRANDLIFSGGRLLVTLDRGSCGFSPADYIPGAVSGGFASIDAETGALDLFPRGYAFPNGISDSFDGTMIAETRGRQVTNLSSGESISLPGAPDNLNPAPDGGVLVALHPNLLRLALLQAGITTQAGSRVAHIDPVGQNVEVLFDDPNGTRFNAATSAVVTGGMLVMGAARDSGLLRCRMPGGA